MSEGPDARLLLPRGSRGYPPRLEAALGREAPDPLFARGDPALLAAPLTALLCSVRVPPELVLPAYDLARSLRDAGVPVVGGFQAPLERECLDFLLRGQQPVVLAAAREIDGMRLPPPWKEAVEGGRMLIVSSVPVPRRPTRSLAARRNRLVAALAERICAVHASPGGMLRQVLAEALSRGTPVACPDHPENRDLLLMGAAPLAGVLVARLESPAPPW